MTGRPPIIEEFWYSIDWDVEAIWALDLPIEFLPTGELVWHLDVPAWPFGGRTYVITPNQVMADPVTYAEEFGRIERCDPGFPIDVTRHKGRWMILDGMHRLAKAVTKGETELRVRKVPRSAVRTL